MTPVNRQGKEPIAIFGAGYVGLVIGACFAELGHDVAIRDIVPENIEALRGSEVPIYEPGLEDLLNRNSERLRYTLAIREAQGAERRPGAIDVIRAPAAEP